MMTILNKASIVATALSAFLLRPCISFQVPNPYMLAAGRGFKCSRVGAPTAPTHLSSSLVSEESTTATISLDPEAMQLKDDLIALADKTSRGFSASTSDRNIAKTIINNLAKYSPSDEPAAAYYTNNLNEANRSTLAGKWTLIYTDAPDITSLEGGPFSTAKLGRIGQECNPPSIKNVIEWTRPEWASSLPFSGGESSRVLQKVCCEGSATKDKPTQVDLKIAGLELSGVNNNDDDGGSGDDAGIGGSLFNGPAGFFESNPVKLQGPLTAPFGKFEILYLDDGMRITKTYQGYYAVNVRDENEWF